MNRRRFLQGSLLTASALSMPARVRAAVEGANSDIRIAVVGFNGRGQNHIAGYSQLPGVRIVALCDVDQGVLDKGVAQLKDKGQDVTPYRDIRKLLESKEVDAISIATPNHWHSLGAIWGCQAGKHVYVEKPVSHNVWEGRQLVRAAAAHKRIVQMGVQSRSASGIAAVLEWAAQGHLGKLLNVHGLCYKRRPSIAKEAGATPIPDQIDYDLWCGPAPKVPLARKKLHYDWHWLWAYGNGDLGNQGIHQMDMARRFLGEPALAPRVVSVGGRLGYEDDGETPNTLVVFQDYKKAPLLFEVRGLPSATDSKEMDQYHGASVGVVAHYEGGRIVCPTYNDAIAYDRDGRIIAAFGKPQLPLDPAEAAKVKVAITTNEDRDNHYANFLRAVRSGRESDLNGKILDGHISSALCHTGNISYQLGRKASAEVSREKLKANPVALESVGRMLTHLEANGVNLRENQLVMGEFLTMDPATEKFVGNTAADALLTRNYRAPFVVPEKV